MARTKEVLKDLIENYLKRKNIYRKNDHWVIKETPLGGFGVFAKRDIECGEIIFLDSPIILGPRFIPNIRDMCTVCFGKENLSKCSKCTLSLCRNCYQNIEQHTKLCGLMLDLKVSNPSPSSSLPLNVMSCLTPLKSLLLEKDDREVIRNLKSHRGNQHGKEIELLISQMGMEIEEEEKQFLIFVCSVLDANAFEVVIGDELTQTSLRDNENTSHVSNVRKIYPLTAHNISAVQPATADLLGLYPLGSLANHRCYPNASHYFDAKQTMIVRATVFIKEGDEIFHSYSRIIWGTTSRIYHLKNTKHFICKCKRCLDPTEFGTYMNAILCDKCKGKVVPREPLKCKLWRCEDCTTEFSTSQIGNRFSMIGSILKGFQQTDFQLMYKFLTSKLLNLVPEYNETAIELKYKMIWILGYQPRYTWTELTLKQLMFKINICQDVLNLLEKLDTGQCKMRGLVLFEIFLCYEELKTRRETCESPQDTKMYFEEAADILKYDVSSPKRIKEYWTEVNVVNGR